LNKMAASETKTQRVKDLKQAVRRTISNLIYDPQLCADLQTHVDDQCSLGFVDPDVNRYLLKLYQMYPDPNEHTVRQDIQTKLLVLALQCLPGDDFITTVSLVTDLDNTDYVQAVNEAFTMLRNCEFVKFWNLLRHGTKTQKKYFLLVEGLKEHIRKYVLGVIQVVYQNIPFHELHDQLGFRTQQETSSLCKDHGFEIESSAQHGKMVQFPVNEANTATLNRKIIKYSVDQMNIFLTNMRS